MMKRRAATAVVLALVLAACTERETTTPSAPAATAVTEAIPGTVPANFSASLTTGPSAHRGVALTDGVKATGPGRPALRTASISSGNLVPVYQAVGKVTLSLDAVGTTASSGIVQVEKRAGTTVRAAFLASSLVCCTGYRIPNGGVSVNGNPVTWNRTAPAFPGSSIQTENYWADVTPFVKATIDGAPVGRVNIAVTEQNSGAVDGDILAVVFDDPSQAQDNTVTLMFGGLNPDGDEFQVTTATPLHPADPNLRLEMSLGIGYGYQPSGQLSVVDVNGQRLTSSAGGQDDGQAANGALITVGGLDDSPANPPPFANDFSGGARTDDELYNLKPFVADGATSISINTVNPSRDDDVFFAALFMTVRADVVNPEVPPDNRPPVANANGPYTKAEGVPVGFTSAGSSDPDANPITFAWNFGDGGTSALADPEHAYADNGTYTVTLTVTDSKGAFTTVTTTANITNIAPIPTAGPMTTVYTGAASTGTGLFKDPGADTWTATVDYGDGSGAQPLTLSGQNFSLSHAYADNGTYTVTITVTDDDGGVGTTTTTATILNRPPVADAGPAITAECNAAGVCTSVTLNGTGSSDPDGHVVAWSWSTPSGTLTGPNPTAPFVLGTSTVTLTVTDDDGATASATSTVTVVDTHPPTLSFTLSSTTLWPPNHKLVTVATGIQATDPCVSGPLAVSFTVTSNEPINGPGDGNTAPDWQVIANANGTYDLQVRSERAGPLQDRIYTITATTSDGHGNTNTVTGTVTVPHDQRGD